MGDEQPEQPAEGQDFGFDGDEHHQAATKVQAMQRGKQDRKAVEQKKADIAQAKEEEEQHAAATKVQAAQRGKQARRDVEEKKEAIKIEGEQHAAATKVQAAQRGKQARREVDGMRNNGADAGGDKGADASKKKLHNPAPVYLERVFKIFDKQGDRSISEPRFVHVLKVMGDDLRDEECAVVYRAVNTHWKEEGNTGINYADFTAWIECTVLGMAVYDALVDQFK